MKGNNGKPLKRNVLAVALFLQKCLQHLQHLTPDFVIVILPCRKQRIPTLPRPFGKQNALSVSAWGEPTTII